VASHSVIDGGDARNFRVDGCGLGAYVAHPDGKLRGRVGGGRCTGECGGQGGRRGDAHAAGRGWQQEAIRTAAEGATRRKKRKPSGGHRPHPESEEEA
jgi:hypothetical protein